MRTIRSPTTNMGSHLDSNGRGDRRFGGVRETIETSSRLDQFYVGEETLDDKRFIELNDGRIVYLENVANSSTTYGFDDEIVSDGYWQSLYGKVYRSNGTKDGNFRFDRTRLASNSSDLSYLHWAQPTPDGRVELVYGLGTAPYDGSPTTYQTYSATMDADGTLHRTAMVGFGFGNVALRDTTASSFSPMAIPSPALTRMETWIRPSSSIRCSEPGSATAKRRHRHDGELLAVYSRINPGTHETSSSFVVKLQRNNAPTGLFSGHDIHAKCATGYYFNVTWEDDDGVDLPSLGSDDVYVILPTARIAPPSSFRPTRPRMLPRSPPPIA